MRRVDPWHIRSVARSGRLWCYVYGEPRKGKPRDPGIPGLHLRVERRAAVSLLLGLRRTHRLVHEECEAWRRPRLAGVLECTELILEKAIHFSGTHQLISFEAVSVFAYDDEDRHLPKLPWSVAGSKAELARNTKGLHELGRAVMDWLFLCEHDYGVHAAKASGGVNESRKTSTIWVWGEYERTVPALGRAMMGTHRRRAKRQAGRKARTRRRL